MSRTVVFVYGLLAYAVFLASFLYAIGFVTGSDLVPKAIDDGVAGPPGVAISINVGMLALFAIQHTIMARPAFKRRWARRLPAAAERSTFVLLSSVILLATFWAWRPLPAVVWSIETPIARGALVALSLFGWGIVFYGSFLIDHFDLFGLRQVWRNLRGEPYVHALFTERSLYRIVRHPLMLGFVIAFWATPHMTVGHLLFAAVTTAYIVVGITIEERDLARSLGPAYDAYRARTPALIPFTKRLARGGSEPPRTSNPA